MGCFWYWTPFIWNDVNLSPHIITLRFYATNLLTCHECVAVGLGDCVRWRHVDSTIGEILVVLQHVSEQRQHFRYWFLILFLREWHVSISFFPSFVDVQRPTLNIACVVMLVSERVIFACCLACDCGGRRHVISMMWWIRRCAARKCTTKARVEYLSNESFFRRV
jgi:hypothetical protein